MYEDIFERIGASTPDPMRSHKINIQKWFYEFGLKVGVKTTLLNETRNILFEKYGQHEFMGHITDDENPQYKKRLEDNRLLYEDNGVIKEKKLPWQTDCKMDDEQIKPKISAGAWSNYCAWLAYRKGYDKDMNSIPKKGDRWLFSFIKPMTQNHSSDNYWLRILYGRQVETLDIPVEEKMRFCIV